MDNTRIRCALISTDAGVHSAVAGALRNGDHGLALEVGLTTPFTQLDDTHLQRLRELDPELVILDIELDPVLGLKFAHFLIDQSPGRRVVAVGPMLSSEQLLVALRAGVAEYLPKPVTREALEQSLGAVARRLRSTRSSAAGVPGQLLAIFSPKGGSGSTTVATNLAIQLHRLTGRRTLLLDLDLELGEIALQLGVEPRFSFIDMVRNFHRMDAELLASFIEHHDTGVHLLSAPYHPERAELVTGDQIAAILQFLKQHYEYVIVDTSKSFSAATLATFEKADQIFLVTVADLPSLRNITRCLPLLRQVTGPADDRVRLVLNRFQADSLIQKRDIEESLGLKVYWTIGNDYDAVMKATNRGSPVILNGPSRYADDVRSLGAEIAGIRSHEIGSRGIGKAVVDPLARLWRRAIQRPPEVKA